MRSRDRFNNAFASGYFPDSGSKFIPVGCAFVGIVENSKETDFNIAPNPTSNKEVKISYTTNSDESYSVKIMNAIGQEVKSVEFKESGTGEHANTIDLHELEAGVYFVKLKGKNSESVKKLLIE